MNFIKTFSAAALGAALATTGQAQAAALADIYQQAQQNDPQLKSALANSQAGQQAAPISKANLLPQIGLQANASTVDSDARDYDSQAYTLSLSQPLFDATSWYGFKQGEEQSELAKLQYGQAQQGLILRVVNAYLDVLRAQTALETSQAQERAIKRRLDQVNAQFEVGLIAI
ncbi:MAG: TolC family protein, partial [Porticoccaceae bacterium]|nr:TolC family protein [Porticoccaceae bacterium]